MVSASADGGINLCFNSNCIQIAAAMMNSLIPTASSPIVRPQKWLLTKTTTTTITKQILQLSHLLVNIQQWCSVIWLLCSIVSLSFLRAIHKCRSTRGIIGVNVFKFQNKNYAFTEPENLIAWNVIISLINTHNVVSQSQAANPVPFSSDAVSRLITT